MTLYELSWYFYMKKKKEKIVLIKLHYKDNKLTIKINNVNIIFKLNKLIFRNIIHRLIYYSEC